MTIRFSIPRWILVCLVGTAAACSSSEPRRADSVQSEVEPASASVPVARPLPGPQRSLPANGASERIAAIGSAVLAWRAATTLATARRGAEEARNLIVGPDGPGYGDSDGDGMIAGATAIGLLPGKAAAAAIALPAVNACVERDVLGGSWVDPAARWSTLQAKIAAWRPDANNFPTLPSHPQRIVGWATLTLRTNTLTSAREYAGHAQIHVDISRRAFDECTG